eukprot:624333-Pleurochrysis_carterae.AAC.2
MERGVCQLLQPACRKAYYVRLWATRADGFNLRPLGHDRKPEEAKGHGHTQGTIAHHAHATSDAGTMRGVPLARIL